MLPQILNGKGNCYNRRRCYSYSVNRGYPVTINFYCYRTIEKSNRGNQTIGLFQSNQDALHTQKRPALNPNRLPDLQKGPGLRVQSRSDNRLNGRDLRFIDRNGRFAETQDLYHTGGLENGQAPLNIKSAEEIAGKEWKFKFL